MGSVSASTIGNLCVKAKMIDVGGEGDYVVFTEPDETTRVMAHFRYGDKEIDWEIKTEDQLRKITLPFDIIVDLKYSILSNLDKKHTSSMLTVVLKSPPKFSQWNPVTNQWVIQEDFTREVDDPAFMAKHVLETAPGGGLEEACRRLVADEPRLV